ncbi:MAG: fibronectin type III domain-containing protein [Candidatus Paceibacterota bacterium]
MSLYKKIIIKFVPFLVFGILLFPNISHGVTLLTDSFTGTTIDTSKWTLVGGVSGVDYIQNNTMNVRNSGTDGTNPLGLTSLRSSSSFAKGDNLTLSANVTNPGGLAFLIYGDFPSGDYYFIRISNTTYQAYIIRGESQYSSNTSCGSYTAAAKVSMRITATSFQVLKNDVLQCTVAVDGTAPVMTSHAFALQGSSTASIFDNALVVNDAALPPSTIPDPISNLAASEWGNTTTNLTWTAPSNGGSTITDYLVDYRISGDLPWISFNDGVSASTGATVTGLTNGVTYQFRVRAVNAIGTALDSNIASVTVLAPTAPSTPSAPTASVVLSLNGDKASVSFSAPSSNGSAITSYTVTSNPGSIVATGSSSPILVTGLTSGTSYNFTVSATNGVGTSINSPASNSISPQAFPVSKINWTEQTNSGQRDWRDVASSSDGTKLVAVVNSGYIYTSNNSGATWTEQTSSGVRNWDSVASSSDGVKLVAANYGGYIYTSSNSGATWTQRTNSGQRTWNDITSSSDGVYLVATNDSNTIYYSTNSGVDWSLSVAGSLDWKAVASSSNGSIVYVLPTGSYVSKSINAGVNFLNNINLVTSKAWTGMAVSGDGVKVFGATNGSYIYTSNDNAENFVEQTNSGQRNWTDISSSLDGSILLASADSVLLSTNGGVDWTTETAVWSWKSIDMSDDGLSVVAVGENGYIYTGEVDAESPTITNINSNKTNGIYTVGEVIDIDVTFSEAVTSTGNVTVTLETGTTDRTCTFTITNSTTGTCNYTVVAGDESSDLTVQSISGTINDQYSNTMTDFVPDTNLATNKAIVIDTTAPILDEVTVVVTPDDDTTPSYTFSSTEIGDITYGGSCASATATTTVGNNTINFSALLDGTYNDCTILVTDSAGNDSNELAINTFVIDTTDPVISEVTPVVTPSSDTTPSYSFTTNEAGDITYGGSCTADTNTATVGTNTISFNILAVGDYADCTIVITDATLNNSNTLFITAFTITTPPITPVADTVSAGSVSVAFLQTLSDRLRRESNLIDTGCSIGNIFSTTTGKKCTNTTNNATMPVSSNCPVLPSAPRLLRLNMNDSSVKLLQQILNCKGYIISDSGAGSPGKETTFFGGKTRDAVLKLQKENNLIVDGIVGNGFRNFVNK